MSNGFRLSVLSGIRNRMVVNVIRKKIFELQNEYESRFFLEQIQYANRCRNNTDPDNTGINAITTTSYYSSFAFDL